MICVGVGLIFIGVAVLRITKKARRDPRPFTVSVNVVDSAIWSEHDRLWNQYYRSLLR